MTRILSFKRNSNGSGEAIVPSAEPVVSTETRSPAREKARKKIVLLTFLIYFLLIFEGSLRKWVLPEYSNVLFFIRDPFVLLVYMIALTNGMWPRIRGLFLFAVILSAVVGVLTIAQLMLPGSYATPLLAGYGWRNYFLYIPLAFIIGEQFKRDDIVRLMRYTLMLSLPIAVLVAVQFFSPPSAWINLQSFSGVAGRVRPAGTFASVAGQMLFATSVVAIVLSAYVAGKRDRICNMGLVVLATAAVFVCLAVSVSRGTLVHSALVLLSAIFAGVVMRGGAAKTKAWVLPLAIVIIGALLYPVLLPEAYDATVMRWSNAHATESSYTDLGIIGRALLGFVIFLSYIPLVPPMGFGMGLGGNASRQIDVELPIVAEDEWARQIVDIGPVFGIIYIIFRIVFTFYLGTRALQATRNSNQALPVILFGFVGIMLLNGQVTGNGVINGYCWLFVGFLMAAIRVANNPHDVAPR